VVHRPTNMTAMMIRTHRGFRVTGVEATLRALAHTVEDEALEIACEDARRRRLTSISALRAYLDHFSRPGRAGATKLRALLQQLDPSNPSKSPLEVKTRRLLVANGFKDFVRELPLTWNGRTYFYDFTFTAPRVILETNSRRWHFDAADYEHDNEKWSVPARHGYRIVMATWAKVTEHPNELLQELVATFSNSNVTIRAPERLAVALPRPAV
jgi:hypothetical protein